ncbi:MAG: isopentenyl-diphosphate Delta-isomerase [Planctomycetota bacterium]
MIGLTLAAIGAAGAAVTFAMTWRNLAGYRTPPADATLPGDTLVSVCVPARNEQDNLRACVESLLAQDHTHLEVLVYDDQSTDATPTILRELCERDERVRAVRAFPLPPGWNGKQHACAQMGLGARGRWLLFTDADVRFEPDAVRRTVAAAERGGVELLSTFPRQITETLSERLVVPMIFFLLFSYLPMRRMRETTMPSASAGCGQFLLVRRDAYVKSGGHTAFPESMHDGIQLPRLIRKHGGRTDLCDATDLVEVRMYQGLRSTWMGFAKNAYEGLGSLGLLVFITLFHALVFVLPWGLLVWGLWTGRWITAGLAVLALGIAVVQRLMLGGRFGQPAWVALLHTPAIVVVGLVQWHSFYLHVTGRSRWRGRGAASADQERVVLVDEQDHERGNTSKIAAHTGEGKLHRAVSVLVFDEAGRLLMQRRSAVKYHFAGRWANSCCGHPRPGEDTVAAGRRRLQEEMGIDTELKRVARFTYSAYDADTGLIEREIDHVLVGRTNQEPTMNLLETDAYRWVTPHDIDAELKAGPDAFAPWFVEVWRAYREAAPRAASYT